MNSEARNFSHTLKIRDLMLTNSSVSSSSPRRSYSFAGEDSVFQSRVYQLEQDLVKKDSEIADLITYNKQILEELQASRHQISELSQNHKQMYSLSRSLTQTSPDIKHLIREVDYLKVLYERGSLSNDSEVLNELINTLSARNKEIKSILEEKTALEDTRNALFQRVKDLEAKLKKSRERFKKQKESFIDMYVKLEQKLNSQLKRPIMHIESLKNENEVLRKKLYSKSTSNLIPTCDKVIQSLMEVLSVGNPQDLVETVKKRDKLVKALTELAKEHKLEFKCTQKLQRWVVGVFKEYHSLKKKFAVLSGDSLVLSQVRRCLGVNSNEEIFEKIV